MHSILSEIGIAILAATALGFIFQLCRQPVILGYLVAGAVVGPEIGFKLVSHPDNIEVISEIGLILLLFIIGLELNPAKLLSAGRKLVYAGLGQFIFCVFLGLGFFLLLGYSPGGGRMDALYLSLFCALSSTAIVVKILYDKFELDTLPGRITLGILIFQDLWAILILALQPNFLNPQIHLMGLALGKGILLLAVGFALSRYGLRWIFARIAKTPEMVVAMSIAWCAFMAGLGSAVGMSMEMGALIAGVAISSFPYGVHVTAKVLPLRDFFLTLFFLSIGMKIPFPDAATLMMSLLIVLFVIGSRFLTVYPILAMSGSGRRTSFITSLNLAQISEFSLVVAALGVSYGHISQPLMSLIIYAMAITSVLASYFIKGNHQLYLAFDGLLTKMGFPSRAVSEGRTEGHEHYPIVILGFHRGASALIDRLEEIAPDLLKKILVIDFNLEALKVLGQRGVKGVFGDISSLSTLEHAHVASADVIVSTLPDMLLKGTSNMILVKACRTIAPNAFIIATADSSQQVEELKKQGANDVLLPYVLIGDHVAQTLMNAGRTEQLKK